MIDEPTWIKIQQMVDVGIGHLAIPQLVEYLKNELTELQLKPLGNLEEMFHKIFETKVDDIKFKMESIVILSKQGAITGVR
jgi:hypothetical protein